jgi:hypothetical protein
MRNATKAVLTSCTYGRGDQKEEGVAENRGPGDDLWRLSD